MHDAVVGFAKDTVVVEGRAVADEHAILGDDLHIAFRRVEARRMQTRVNAEGTLALQMKAEARPTGAVRRPRSLAEIDGAKVSFGFALRQGKCPGGVRFLQDINVLPARHGALREVLDLLVRSKEELRKRAGMPGGYVHLALTGRSPFVDHVGEERVVAEAAHLDRLRIPVGVILKK